MSWAHSKKFRFGAKALFKHLCKQEVKWRAVVEQRVKTFSPEEVAAYSQERGLPIAPSIQAQLTKKAA